jgi:outer membrane lipoprotein-sorting protein
MVIILAQFLIFAAKIKNMKIILFAFCILSLSAISQETKDAKSQGILDKLSTKMKGMKSFYIEFSANIKNSSSGTNETATGKGWVKDKKFYASYGDNTIISNGLKTWTIVKEEKSVYESDASSGDGDAINPKKLLTIWETGFKNKYEKEETLNGETVHVIYLYPKNAKEVDYHTIILYISKSSTEMKKAILKSKDGTVMTYSMTKFTANEEIDDSKFVFDPKKYPGYPIIKD